jgi:hypothetical protein
MELPMLEEHEWERIFPLLRGSIEEVKRYRDASGISLAEAFAKGIGRDALALYYSITGFQELNVNALWHHRLSLFGPPCATCGKPLRTPAARFCAACGADRAMQG